MEIYLLPTLDDYALFAKIEARAYSGFGKNMVGKFKVYEDKWIEEGGFKGKLLKYIRKKLETKEEIILKHARKADSVTIKYPDSMREEDLWKGLEGICYDGRALRVAWIGIYGVAVPVSFVIAPFVPFLNWGFTAFFAYKFLSNIRVLQGASRIMNRSVYVKDSKLSSLEKMLKEDSSYLGVVSSLKGSEHEFLLDFYEPAYQREINKHKVPD